MSEYREILNQNFKNRQSRNSRYSQAAFARDLGLAPSTLSNILNKNHNLSITRGVKVANKLGLTGPELKLFHASIQENSLRNEEKRRKAEEAVSLLNKYKTRNKLTSYLKVLSSWEHFAILELLILKKTKAEVAESLSLDIMSVKTCIRDLELVGFISIDSTTREISINSETTQFRTKEKSKAIQEFHKNFMKKAEQSLDIPLEKRNFQTIIFSCPESDFLRIRGEIQNFIQNIQGVADSAKISKGEKNVYALGLQCFPLSN